MGFGCDRTRAGHTFTVVRRRGAALVRRLRPRQRSPPLIEASALGIPSSAASCSFARDDERNPSRPGRTLFLVLTLSTLAACAKAVDVKLGDIPNLPDLEAVMHANESVGGKQWSKAGESEFSPEQFGELKETATRMEALAERSKKFSRGPEFDKFADKMVTLSKTLGTASDAKDGKAAGLAVSDMKQTCKDCHAATR